MRIRRMVVVALGAGVFGAACTSDGGDTPPPEAAAPAAEGSSTGVAPAAPSTAPAAPAAEVAAGSPPTPPDGPPTPPPIVAPPSGQGGGVGDTCANPIAAALTNGLFQVSGRLDGFSNAVGDHIAATGYSWAGSDVFYALEATAGTRLSISLNESGAFDGGIYVFTDCGAPVASVIGGLDTTPSRPFELTVPATGRLFIAVDAWQPTMTTGAYELRVAVIEPSVGSGGDSCANALPLSFVNGVATATADLAAFSNTEQSQIDATGYSWTGHDVFYALNAAAGERFTIELDDRGTFDGGVYVVSDCNNVVGSVVGGADTSPGSTVEVTAPQAGRLVLVVDSWAGATTGNYQLTVRSAATAPAGNSLCQVGAGISVLWNGTWYNATVKEVRPEGCFIGYDGYASSWDEAVGPDRMRAR